MKQISPFILLSLFAAGAACSSLAANPPPKTGPEETDVGDPINFSSGAVWRKSTDIAIPCPGFDLTLARTYLHTGRVSQPTRINQINALKAERNLEGECVKKNQ